MTAHDDIEASASEWLARRDGDHWSEALQRELDAWLDASTAHRVAFLRLESVWQRTQRLSALRVPALPGRAIAPPPRRLVAWPLAAGLAAVAVLCAGGAWWNLGRHETDYSAALGARQPVVLADGTHILLNTHTRLSAHVDARDRHVRLEEGEAYFEVAHDPAHPFVIDAGTHRITVLGTKFDVRRDGDDVRVTVVEGRVRVEPSGRDGAARAVVLTADELAVATTSDAVVSRRTPTQTSRELSWRTGRLSFDDVTLEQAAREFNRYNRKQLVLTDARSAQMRIGGSFNADNVEDFARLLRDGFGLHVHEDEQTIRVSG